MATCLNTSCRRDALRNRPGPCVARQVIAQPVRARLLYSVTVYCNAAVMGQPAQTDDMHSFEQQNHQQQQRWAPATPQPTRKQLIRPVYCVAVDVPVSAGAATAVANTQDTSSSTTTLLDSLQLNISADQIEQRPSNIVIDVDAESVHVSSSSSSAPAIRIKAAVTGTELKAVAELRAEAYYADDHSRFAQSFKRQFAAQEVESLRQRTAASSSSGRAQLCECLVAVDAGSSSGSVLGCIDIRLPQTKTGLRCIGVPEGDDCGCYLLNVVVSESHRGCGIGKQLMRAAMARAVHCWGSQRLYTHVEADNEVASGLYRGCGFREHSSEAKYANASDLGRLVLLTADAADAPTLEETLWKVEG